MKIYFDSDSKNPRFDIYCQSHIAFVCQEKICSHSMCVEKWLKTESNIGEGKTEKGNLKQ